MFIDDGNNIIKIKKDGNSTIRSTTSRYKIVLAYSNNKIYAEFQSPGDEIENAPSCS